MAAPKCPTDLQLQRLIDYYSDFVSGATASCKEEEDMIDNASSTTNALRYLQNYLRSRKGYQRKMQIKRQVLAKYAKEHGFDREIDDAVKSMHANVMEAESLDDLEDSEDSEDE